MGLDVSGIQDLTKDLNDLAYELDDQSNAKTVKYCLQAGAQPILTRMVTNASHDPQPRTHTLVNIIKIGNVTKHRRRGGWTIWIGIKRTQGGAKHANPVEYGHGGPHPAPAHPFIRPAFDEGKEEAYSQIKSILRAALDARRK